MEGGEILINQEQSPNQERLKVDCYVSTIASEDHLDQHNEDTHFFDPNKGIFGVFDGMGGMQGGQWCAETSRQIIQDYLQINSYTHASKVEEKLKQACVLANDAVYKENNGKGGTTATFGLLCRTDDGVSQIAIANSGDSRAYLYRDGKLLKLTVDDNYLNHVEGGKSIQLKLDDASNPSELTKQELQNFKSRRIVSDSFGSPDNKPKINIHTVLPDDILVLTTDGIHDNLTTTEISEIISQNSKNPILISEKLTQEAQKRSREGVFRSKKDDMTVLVTVFSKDESLFVSQPETAKPPTEFTPKVGQEITRQRSNGDIEGGWRIFSQQDGLLGVQKGDVWKRIKVSEVERYNRLVRIDDIATSLNVIELKYTIEKLGGLTGSKDFYPAKYLLEKIDSAIASSGSKESLQYLTGAGELRQTVQRLIENKKRK